MSYLVMRYVLLTLGFIEDLKQELQSDSYQIKPNNHHSNQVNSGRRYAEHKYASSCDS